MLCCVVKCAERCEGGAIDRLRLLVAGTVLVMGVAPAFGGTLFGPAPVPDWVKTAAQEKLPEFHGNPKAVVLLDETTYAVDEGAGD